MEKFYRRIRRMGKFLVTRKRDGGARYFVTKLLCINNLDGKLVRLIAPSAK